MPLKVPKLWRKTPINDLSGCPGRDYFFFNPKDFRGRNNRTGTRPDTMLHLILFC